LANKKQSIIEGGLVLTAALLVVKLLGAFYQIQLGNVIGETAFGYYTTAYNLCGIVYAVAVTGFPVALSKIVSEFSARGRYNDIQRAERLSLRLFLLVGILGFGFLVVFAPLYAGMPNINMPELIWLIWGFAPAILFCCLMSVYRGYNQGLNNMTPTAISQVVETLVKVAVGLAGAILVRNYLDNIYDATGMVLGAPYDAAAADTFIHILAGAGAMVGLTASSVAGWAFLAVRRWSKGSGIRKAQFLSSPSALSNKEIVRRIIWLSVPISLSAAISQLAGLLDNSIVLGTLSDHVANNQAVFFASFGGVIEKSGETLENVPRFIYGAYSLLNKIPTLVPTLTGSFGMSALPLVSAAWGAKNRLETKKGIEASIRITMLLAAPAGFGIAFLGGPISWFLYSDRPLTVALGPELMTYLGVVDIFIALMGITNSMLQAIGRIDVPIKLMAMGLVIKGVSEYFLVGIPTYSINGLPASNLLCYGFISLMGMLILSRSTGIRFNVAGTLLKPMAAGVVTGVGARLVYNLAILVLGSKYSTVIAILAAVVLYVLALGALRAIEREDVESLPGGKKLSRVLEKFRIIR
jgi:stage V sporulation protein B